MNQHSLRPETTGEEEGGGSCLSDQEPGTWQPAGLRAEGKPTLTGRTSWGPISSRSSRARVLVSREGCEPGRPAFRAQGRAEVLPELLLPHARPRPDCTIPPHPRP